MDEGVLEARAAPGTAKSHGEYGSQSLGYGGPVPRESAGYDIQTAYDAERPGNPEFGDWGFEGSGEPIDKTPDVHCSPYPRGIIQDGMASLNTPGGLEIVGQQMRQLHGRDLGGVTMLVRHDPADRQTVTRYSTDRYPAPNESVQGRNVPGQIRPVAGTFGGGGYYGSGQADTVQGYGKLNNNPEFQKGHSIRRIQHDRMPWDFTGTHGEQDVPFHGRHEVRQQQLYGPDSPYFDAGDISGANIPWEGRIGFPSDYVQAPEPYTLPANLSSPHEDRWAYA
jgi:hypothetical protein